MVQANGSDQTSGSSDAGLDTPPPAPHSHSPDRPVSALSAHHPAPRAPHPHCCSEDLDTPAAAPNTGPDRSPCSPRSAPVLSQRGDGSIKHSAGSAQPAGALPATAPDTTGCKTPVAGPSQNPP